MSEEDLKVLRLNAAMVTSQVREILSGERRAGNLTLNSLASIAAGVPALLDRIEQLEAQLSAAQAGAVGTYAQAMGRQQGGGDAISAWGVAGGGQGSGNTGASVWGTARGEGVV